jgi:hypothetical protein
MAARQSGRICTAGALRVAKYGIGGGQGNEEGGEQEAEVIASRGREHDGEIWLSLSLCSAGERDSCCRQRVSGLCGISELVGVVIVTLGSSSRGLARYRHRHPRYVGEQINDLHSFGKEAAAVDFVMDEIG